MKQQNIPPDIRVFNILLKGYSRRGGVSAIPGILQEMADACLKPSAVTYNTLIDTFVRAGQLSQARQTCTDAQAAGLPKFAFMLLASPTSMLTCIKSKCQHGFQLCFEVCFEVYLFYVRMT